MSVRGWSSVALLLLVACGGGGGGGDSVFLLSGSSPAQGATEAELDSPVLLVFNRPADLATLQESNITFQEADGTPVPFQILVQGANAASVTLSPLADLKQNVKHTIRLSSAIRDRGGSSLRDQVICFVTKSLTPTVRPDQLIDLGDALQVPRYLAAHVKLGDGRVVLFGGYTDAAAATDTIEIYDPDTRSFRLLDARLSVPRAEHTATLLQDGRVFVVGGVSEAGGEPLASCDVFRLSTEAVTAGPPLQQARRSHAASPFLGGESVMVSGGYDAEGTEMDTVERWIPDQWMPFGTTLGVPSVHGIQINYDYDKVYFSASNLSGVGGYFNGGEVVVRQETDIRFRSTYARVGSGVYLIVGGDTRSAVTYDFGTNIAREGTDLLWERRGAHSLTPRGLAGRRLLVAGGFNIAQLGAPALRTLEIVDFLDPGPFGFPDVAFYRVDGVQLPVPFAGHAGFTEPGGPTVLAGGWGDGAGPHSRRVVVVLDNASSSDGFVCD